MKPQHSSILKFHYIPLIHMNIIFLIDFEQLLLIHMVIGTLIIIITIKIEIKRINMVKDVEDMNILTKVLYKVT